MFCAMDFSGTLESGNFVYLAVVACTDEFLDQLIGGADLARPVNAIARKKSRRLCILAKLDARKPGCLILCVKTDKSSVLSKINYVMQRQKKNPKTEAIAYAYHNAVMDLVGDELDEFLKRHGESLQEIRVEADHDCWDLLKHTNMRRTGESYAHMVADAVAWANNRGDEPPGAKSLDVTAHAYKTLKAKFGKRKPKIKRRRT